MLADKSKYYLWATYDWYYSQYLRGASVRLSANTCCSRMDSSTSSEFMVQALKEAGLTANPTKCEWGGCHVLYLGHVVGSGHLAVPEARAKAMQDYILLETKKGLRSFLGV